MQENLKEIEKNALAELESVQDEGALDKWRVTHLGRSSAVMQVFAGLGSLSKEERPVAGQQANQVKQALEKALAEKTGEVKQAALQQSLAAERLDVTLPGRPCRRGRLHPATANLRRILGILAGMGFQVYTSRDVESDEYNFQLLNIPPHHPAREMQDTFYIDSHVEDGTYATVLRTHTSPGQIRAMREFSSANPQNPPPIRVALPGMVYRFEQITFRSEMQFYQVEGLAVGETITFGDLKGTLLEFARRMFGREARFRFRADHFPFTEPSAEMDVECYVCGGKGCPVCKKSGWLEILGCGMVHPAVLENGGYDPRRFSGFAFGMGTERQLMLRYKINDIRHFWGNDIRFLEQF
ncbi:MAG: phenylalanine--tRNA ligase subunit alpha [Chloroflexi bacterium]|nr:phenylalanine--tRNA ligase subunit alpha [Chloroflexota bacterium]